MSCASASSSSRAMPARLPSAGTVAMGVGVRLRCRVDVAGEAELVGAGSVHGVQSITQTVVSGLLKSDNTV